MATLAPAVDFRSLSRQPPADPDIHATLSDFLTYTEHLPAHVTRALTLIGDQRMRAEQRIKLVHEQTTIYSRRPLLHDKPDPQHLRKSISYALEDAERACRMAVEEANRLHATCEREAKKLDVITEKLRSQPMPPSRDPTPEQQALTSPNLKRERGISTRGEDAKTDKPRRHLTDKAAAKLRGRKIMVPGEVLPPPDPNAIPESISDWTSPRASPPLEQAPATNYPSHSPIQKARAPKPLLTTAEVERRDKSLKPRASRPSGQPGTNAHSAIAGISTSNALLALSPPPEDAVNGSKWLPWMKLTEWEMAKLRKRMKKNAIWVPSQTMVRRELKVLGRGLTGKDAARQLAEATGEVFVDEHNDPDPTKVVVTGEESAQMIAMLGPQLYADDEDADAELINRGMRLNEAKKLKRQRMLEDQALQTQIERDHALDVPTDGKGLSGASDVTKKRKREATPLAINTAAGLADTPDPLSRSGPVPKKLKISTASTSNLSTAKVPLAAAGPSSSPRSTSARNRRAATPQATRKPTLVLKAGKAVSEEPPNRRTSLRRGSNVSLPNGDMLTSPLRTNVTPSSSTASTKAADRRSRRPAPGILTHTDDGDAKVGVSKRKAAPRKRVSAAAAAAAAARQSDHLAAAAQALIPTTITTPTEAPEEYVDPDEPRYCVCGDVSWGTMIACDNVEDCEKEWFHLSCVGLTELPPRRTKWYCPDCRKKLRLGMGSNGLVGRQQGR